MGYTDVLDSIIVISLGGDFFFEKSMADGSIRKGRYHLGVGGGGGWRCREEGVDHSKIRVEQLWASVVLRRAENELPDRLVVLSDDIVRMRFRPRRWQ